MTNKYNDPIEQLLLIKAVAELLNTSVKTIYRRIKAGELPVVRDGRFLKIRPTDLRAYIALRRCE